jgi:hypothetical protein
VSVYQGDAEVRLRLHLRDGDDEEEARAVIRGEITYHDSPSSITFEGDPEPTLFPEIRLHGTVEPLIVPNVPSCDEAVEGLPAALFEGTYRPQDKAHRGQLLHRTHRGRLQRLHPGRLHRGRQRPGGAVALATRRSARGAPSGVPSSVPPHSRAALALCPSLRRVQRNLNQVLPSHKGALRGPVLRS